MIIITITTFITIPAQKLGHLRIHKEGEVLADYLLNVCSNHLKKTLGLLFNFVFKLCKYVPLTA
jgi:hypothetical protein